MKRILAEILLFVLITPLLVPAQTAAKLTSEPIIATRIKRVEQGLLPAVLIKGDPSWSIEERMKHYKAPIWVTPSCVRTQGGHSWTGP